MQDLKKKLDADGLSRSQAFNNLMSNASFQSLMRAQDLRLELGRVVSMSSFADLVNNSSFQSVLARSEFQKALQSDLNANIRQSAAKK